MLNKVKVSALGWTNNTPVLINSGHFLLFEIAPNYIFYGTLEIFRQ